MSPPKYTSIIQPRFSDFDLQGILNSRQYLDLVGEARTDQMKRCYGIPIEKYSAAGLTFVIRTFEIEYRKPIFYGAEFQIETWAQEIRGPLAVICFRFTDTSGGLLYANGTIKYFLVDLKTKKAVDFAEEDKKIYLGL